MKSETKNCQNCKKDFVIESEDFNFYEKIKVPAPTWCPICRAMRRFIWRNERSLYHDVCAFSGEKIISMFNPELKLTVYDRDIWWGDKWDPTEYGMEYDFSKPFFEQYKELLSRVPLASLGNTNCVKSDYGNHNADCKNCYLTFASFTAENVFYSRGVVNGKDSYDLYESMKPEQCYGDILCASLYNTDFSYDSDDCIDSSFLTACLNLQNCLGCVNLRHKSHCIFNKQYSKEEYEKERAQYDFGSYKVLEKFKKEYDIFLKKQPRRYATILKSKDVTGDNIINSKNSKFIFDSFGNVENSKYVAHTMDLREGYDGYGIGAKGEFLYEGVDFGINGARNYFGVLNHRSMETNYTYMCYSSKNLFGCIGLRKQEYCILNKKYSKTEYEKLLPKVVEHMNNMPYVDKKGRVYRYGEFFPTDISPFAYNETIAEEYYPLTKEEAGEYDFKWKEKEGKNYKIDISAGDLPDHIKDVDDSICEGIIGCLHGGSCDEQCTVGFKILPEELQFYKKKNLALPRLCPNCRHFQRLNLRNPMNLWHRKCMKEGCNNEFETSYAPDRPEIVYCEKCYQQEMY